MDTQPETAGNSEEQEAMAVEETSEPVKEEVIEVPEEETKESSNDTAPEAPVEEIKEAADVKVEEAVEEPKAEESADVKGEEPEVEEPKTEDSIDKKAEEPKVGPKVEEKAEETKESVDVKAEEPKVEKAEEATKAKAKAKKPKASTKKAKTEKVKEPVKEEPEPAPVEETEAPEPEEPRELTIEERLGIKELLFSKYNLSEVVVHDLGLERYINLKPIVVPHSGAKNANVMFGKRKMSIIERLINNMMRTETYTGKKSKAYNVVRDAFEIIEKRAKNNPVQVFVEALEHAAPMEEITRLRYGGISVPKAVDISPSRRLDVALRNICIGATKSSFKKKKSISQCLAEEIMTAARGDLNSFAVSKKDEKERVAGSAR